MEQEGHIISVDSTKQELLDYLDNHFRPLACANPLHRYQYMDICLMVSDQQLSKAHKPYQLLCYNCIRQNCFQCTGEKHQTSELIDTLRHLIQQTDKITANSANFDQLSQSGQYNLNQGIQQLLQSMKTTVSDLRRARVMIEEQITKVETEKIKLENELSLKNEQYNQKLKDFKDLLVQILRQDNSQYFQQYISKLENYTQVDKSGNLAVCLEKDKKEDKMFQYDYSEQLKLFQKNVNEWVTIIPNLPKQMSKDQYNAQNELMVAFSYLLNEQQINQDMRLLLADVDTFNQKILHMRAVSQIGFHKNQEQINSIKECVAQIKSLCSSIYLSPEHMALAKFLLGFCWFFGVGCEKNQKDALKVFLESDQCLNEKIGYGVAQNWIGYCFLNGTGAQVDLVKAIKYYQTSAQQGYATAQNNLGYCFQYGEGVEKDAQQAVSYYLLAVQQGHASAQSNLGFCYDNGEGVLKDMAQAVKYYRLAAEQGNAIALSNLGICYENGEGVEKDMVQAVKYYRMAAEQGNASAQYNLGCCYNTGAGVQKNVDEAKKYFQKAADQGFDHAKEALKKLV